MTWDIAMGVTGVVDRKPYQGQSLRVPPSGRPQISGPLLLNLFSNWDNLSTMAKILEPGFFNRRSCAAGIKVPLMIGLKAPIPGTSLFL